MRADELKAKVAQAADVPLESLTDKTRPGAQIKANALWEGSCSPAAMRKRAGVFFAKDAADLAVEGAVRRLSLELPFPQAVLVISQPGQSTQKVTAFGYAESDSLSRIADVLDTDPVVVPRPTFAWSASWGRPRIDVSQLRRNLTQTPNVVLQGPPGTGKTSTALELVRSLAGGDGAEAESCRFSSLAAAAGGAESLTIRVEEVRALPVIWEMVQLHPGYAYDDLIRRIAPRVSEGGQLKMAVEDGLLPQLCRIAEVRGAERPVVLILDEINRADLASVLGEFVFAIDAGHRGVPVRLQYQGGDVRASVAVPPNLWIVGTMNTADRSIAMVDHAIRRRFRFIDVPSSPAVFAEWYGDLRELTAASQMLYESCNEDVPSSLKVGHAAFLEPPHPLATWADRVARRVAYHVLPLLSEYVKEGLKRTPTISIGETLIALDASEDAEAKVRGAVQAFISDAR